jgi:hypothetical protein
MRSLAALIGVVIGGCGGGGSLFQEAAHPPLPLITTRGGTVLSAARITAVTFAGDPLAADMEAFVSAIGHSQYWDATTSEYGVGPATATAPVRVATAAPATIDDAGLQTFLAAQLASTSAGWPAPGAQSLYVIFFPQSSTITERNGNRLCAGAAGYHAWLPTPTGQRVAYAVVARCLGSQHVTRDSVSLIASHEIVEAATDPHLDAYLAPSPLDYAWTYTMTGGEVGDLCEHDVASDFYAAELGFVVQRTWSNAAALSGHDPCVPRADGDAYFGAAPVLGDTLMLTFNKPGAGRTMAATGVHVPVGGQKTIALQLFSDAPTGPIDVWAEEFPINAALQQPADLRLALDKASGMNGATLNLTIQVMSDGAGEGHQYLTVYAQSGDQQHRWPVVVGN